MQFHRALRPPEPRPEEHRKARVNGGEAQGERLAPEPEAVLGRPAPAARQQPAEQLLAQLVRLLGVDPRQRRPRHPPDAKVVKPLGLRRQVGDDVAQAAPPRQLPQGQRHELRPAGHAAQLAPLVVALGPRLDLMSRHKLEQLG